MDPPSLDDLFSALADSRRRAVCQHFETGGDDVADLAELVDHVVERERTRGTVGPSPESPTDHRLDVEVELYHVHLPVLSEVGAVEFDPRGECVRYLGHPAIETILAEVNDSDALCV